MLFIFLYFFSSSVYACSMCTVSVQGLLVLAVKTTTVVPMTCAAALVHLSACISY